MLKIAFITFSRTRNYGGILQAYGLYQYLVDCGYDVEIIDYIPERCNVNNRELYVKRYTQKSRIWGMCKLTRKIWDKFFYPREISSYEPFWKFMDENVKFTKPYYSLEELKSDVPEADIYITGSDQVWNSSFTEGKIDTPLFLEFAPNDKRKISYASSFGSNTIDNKEANNVKKLLERYYALSVREESGEKILKDMGLDGTVVIDPTMLCERATWDKIVSRKLESKPYLFVYLVKYNKKVLSMAKRVAKTMKLKLVVVTMNRMDAIKMHCGAVVSPSINDWLSYIKCSEAVITDSFHATIFSILFHKPFVVNSGVRASMSGRISTLLNTLELKQQESNSFVVDEICNILKKAIDFKKADELLSASRDFSRAWLNEAIEGEKSDDFQEVININEK